MNNGIGQVSDEMLSAWVDGELAAEQRQQVEQWLRTHPQDQARVQAWAADRTALAGRFGPVLDEPLPPQLAATVWRGRALPRWALVASAAGLLVVGGLLGGAGVGAWKDQRHAQDLARLGADLAAGTVQGWVQRAALAHAVYVAEPRHAVEVKAQEEHLSRWLTRRIDMPVKLFDLHDQGFELVGGRLLPDGPGKSAQLMYQDAQQRRVTVYLRKPGEGTDAAFRYEQRGKLGMFYWVEAGAGYALVGELPKATLLALAQSIYAQFPGSQVPATPAPAPVTAPAPAPAAPPASPVSGGPRG